MSLALLIFPRHVMHAAKHPVELDDRQIDAVSARVELDLRIGFAFTRLQTLALRPLVPRDAHEEKPKPISYGI